MKTILAAIIVLFTFHSSFAQVKHVDLLVGRTSAEVSHYFDSLISLKSKRGYKIKRSASATGDSTLRVEFGLADEYYYTCLTITTDFIKIVGIQICNRQYITGRPAFARPNLDFIRNNFEQVYQNRDWEKVIVPGRYKVTTASSFNAQQTYNKLIFELKEIK